jgi:hypothetical protein
VRREAADLISRSTQFVKASDEDIKEAQRAYKKKQISDSDYPAVGYCLVYYNNYYTVRKDIAKSYEDAFRQSLQELDASGLPPAAVKYEKDNLWRRRDAFYNTLDDFTHKTLRSAPELTEARIAAAEEIAQAKSEAKPTRPQLKLSATPAPEGISISNPPKDFSSVYGINLLYDANSQRWLARIGSSTRPDTKNLDATVGPLLKKIQDRAFYAENAGTLGMRFAEHVLVSAILPEIRKAAQIKAGRWQSVTTAGLEQELTQEVYEKLIRPSKKGKNLGVAPIRSFDYKKYDKDSPARGLIKHAIGLLTTATREQLRKEQAGGITSGGDVLGFKLIIKVGDKPTEVLAIDRDGSVSWVTVATEEYPDIVGEGSTTRKKEFTKNFIEQELAGLSLGYYYGDKLERIDALDLAGKEARFIAYYKDPETGKQSYSRRLEAMPQLETGEETLSVDDEGETSFYENSWEPGVLDEDVREDETVDVESEYYAPGADALAQEGIETIEDLEEYLESRLEDASESRAALNAVRLLAVFALVLFYSQRSEEDAGDMKAYILHKFYGVPLGRISAMDIIPKKKGEGPMVKSAVKKRIDAVDTYVLAELKRLGLEVDEAARQSSSAPTAARGKYSAKPVLRRIMNPRSSMYNPILAALIRYGRGYKRR